MHLERIHPKNGCRSRYPHGCTAYCPPSVHYHSANVLFCCNSEVHRNPGNGKFWPKLCKNASFSKIAKIFTIKQRSLCAGLLHMEKHGNIAPIVVSVSHFEKSLFVFTQPGPKAGVQIRLKKRSIE